MADANSDYKDSGSLPALPGSAVVENLGSAARRLGLVTDSQIAEAVAAQQAYAVDGLRMKIGEVLVEKRYLTVAQLEKIVRSQTVSKARIGDYELISKLGEGGMGAVYKARQMSMDRVVAVKVLSPAHAKNPEYRNRFESEARAVARLNHPNIVTGIDAGHSNGFYYFAMEFVDGETLGQYQKRSDGRLDEREALKIVRQVALALKHAHSNNIVHRDVKPDNVLLDHRRSLVKLADLGLARDAIGEDLSSTRSGQAVGTPFYMSPEQASGKSVSPATDFYSLGGTLYHVLTGQIPYSGASAALIMARHIKDPVPNPRVANPNVSQATAKLVIKCLQKDPRERFQTADELIQEIDRITTGTKQHEATSISNRSKPQTTKHLRDLPNRESAGEVKPAAVRRKPVRRNRDNSTLGIMFLLFVLIVGAVGVYTFMTTKTERPKKKDKEKVLREN